MVSNFSSFFTTGNFDLPGNEFTGTLTDEFSGMTNLINLLLDGNKLEGDIEEVLDGLNDSLGKYFPYILEVYM